MKILLIKTLIGTADPDYFVYFDMGIGSIAAVLKQKGYEVNYFLLDDWKSFETLKKRIVDFNPDVIGFSALQSTYEGVKQTAKKLKKIFPQIFYLCGGIHVTLCPEEFVTAKGLDAICLGEGEFALAEFLEAYEKKDKSYLKVGGFWFRDGETIIKTKRRELVDVNVLPFPDREIFGSEGLNFSPMGEDHYKRRLEFIFSRGCPFQCNYCTNPALSRFHGRGYVRFMDPDKAVDEVKDVVSKYRADSLLFHDDLFTMDRDWLFKFLKRYRDEVGLPFECNIRVGKTATREILKELKISGCSVVKIGVECGDEKIRKEVLGRNMPDKEIMETFDMAKEIGLNVLSFVMVGLPDETRVEVIKTIKLIADINPDGYALYIFFPYKGTGLYDLCLKKRYIAKEKRKEVVERLDTILDMPNLSRKDIMHYYKNFEILLRLRRDNKDLIFNILCIEPSNRLYFPSKVFLKLWFKLFGKKILAG